MDITVFIRDHFDQIVIILGLFLIAEAAASAYYLRGRKIIQAGRAVRIFIGLFMVLHSVGVV